MSVLNPSAAYQTLPIVMVAFFKDNSAFVRDILLRFQNCAGPSFGYGRQIAVK